MSRWAISPIIGDGTATIVDGSEATTGPYRASVAAHNVPMFISCIPGNDDGTPKYAWAICKVPTATEMIALHSEWDQSQKDDFTSRYNTAVAALTADGEIRLMPDLPMSHVLTGAQATVVKNNIFAKFSITGFEPTGRTVQETLRYIVDQVDITWDVS
jgi:hypothetical protein